jgi:hypothetical protein
MLHAWKLTFWCANQRRRQLVIHKFHQKRESVANVTKKKKWSRMMIRSWTGQATRLARNQVTHALVPPFLLPGQADRLLTCRGLGPVSLPITLRSDSSFLMHSQDRKRFHSRKFLWLLCTHLTWRTCKNAMHQSKQAKVHDRHVPIWSIHVDVGYKPITFCRRRKGLTTNISLAMAHLR